MQKEREHGGKAAVWMNVGRRGERGAGEGEKVWDEAMGLYRRKYRETNRGMEILGTTETCIPPQHKTRGEATAEVALSPCF